MKKGRLLIRSYQGEQLQNLDEIFHGLYSAQIEEGTSWILHYEEKVAQGGGVISLRCLNPNKCWELQRSGTVEQHFIFDSGQETEALYRSELGVFRWKIVTQSCLWQEVRPGRYEGSLLYCMKTSERDPGFWTKLNLSFQLQN